MLCFDRSALPFGSDEVNESKCARKGIPLNPRRTQEVRVGALGFRLQEGRVCLKVFWGLGSGLKKLGSRGVSIGYALVQSVGSSV